ncbi:hypothetical protein Lal_00018906 [Lupinus albus]|nr:hypothetical protein Lal_00018906 [Lupinus albus]
MKGEALNWFKWAFYMTGEASLGPSKFVLVRLLTKTIKWYCSSFARPRLLLLEIMRELSILRQSSVAEALGLAKLVESNIKDFNHHTQ